MCKFHSCLIAVFGQSDKDLAGSEDNFDDDSYYYNSRPLTDSQQQ